MNLTGFNFTELHTLTQDTRSFALLLRVIVFLSPYSPALVANLWDVTDADIDRFCQSLLKLWLDDPAAASLLDCVARSRAVCKLPWLIGTSPIVYGIPSCIHS